MCYLGLYDDSSAYINHVNCFSLFSCSLTLSVNKFQSINDFRKVSGNWKLMVGCVCDWLERNGKFNTIVFDGQLDFCFATKNHNTETVQIPFKYVALQKNPLISSQIFPDYFSKPQGQIVITQKKYFFFFRKMIITFDAIKILCLSYWQIDLNQTK